ncbi:MAG: TRAP transporter permease [Synergistaceae bacterium]|jgi:TRAP transporter 4TM/12TM fusion protein|nr:TRAP transporter permease [Synergistaceae bacterium]
MRAEDERPVENQELNSKLARLDSDFGIWEPKGFWKKIVFLIAVTFSCFQLYTAIFGSLAPQLQRSIHLGFALVLAYILFPAGRGKHERGPAVLSIIFALASIAVVAYWNVFYLDIIQRAGEMTQVDFAVSLAATLLVLEATRRTCGLPVLFLGIMALLYCYFGNYIPGFFNHRGFRMLRIFTYMYLSTEGILGVPIGVVSNFVFLFLLFGAFLSRTGVSVFFNDFANAICGGSVGGPAKVAVVSSALQGMISGSSIANVVGSGSFTIPAMKKTGYTPEFAAAVEASASTGGQLMPPVMGAAAFLMAEFTGISYGKIALSAAIPALLYFTGIFMSVHLEAKRLGLKGLPREEIPALLPLLFRRGILFTPIIVIVAVLGSGYTPMRAGLLGIVTSIVVGALFRESRIGVRDVFECLQNGAKLAIGVAAVSATAGIIVGSITLTGLGLKMANGLVELANGNLLLTMFFTMISSLILGMGVPTTANYVITSTICSMALIQLNVPIIAAHLFVFYFGIIADITPPVCSAVFAGAAIARANPMKAGINATKLAIGAFIVPYMFVLSPELVLVDVHWFDLMRITIGALMGMFCVASAIQGWFQGELNLFFRFVLLTSGILLIHPGYFSDITGLICVAALFLYSKWRTRTVQANSSR